MAFSFELSEELKQQIAVLARRDKKTVEIINMLHPDIAYIDCPSNNIKAYKRYLLERIKNKKI